jgi:DNA-binding NarL/FixJ family response regulator
MDKPIRILLADDHQLVRAGIRALLDAMPGVTVVAEASDGSEALELAREHRPDIALLDISMKTISGLEAARRLRDEMPAIRVIMLSMHATADFVKQALENGAAAYLIKDSATAELGLAIQAVKRGENYLSPAVSRQVVEGYLQAGKAEAGPLTPRQTEILTLIAQGLQTKEIAHRLELSAKTVETHRAQIMERLAIRDIAGLVRYAIRSGLIKAE